MASKALAHVSLMLIPTRAALFNRSAETLKVLRTPLDSTFGCLSASSRALRHTSDVLTPRSCRYLSTWDGTVNEAVVVPDFPGLSLSFKYFESIGILHVNIDL